MKSVLVICLCLLASQAYAKLHSIELKRLDQGRTLRGIHQSRERITNRWGSGNVAIPEEDLVDSMIAQNSVEAPVFSFYLNRNPDDSNGGKLVLGGSDKNLYTGDMNYIPLSQTTYWQVNMDGVSVNGEKSREACPNGCEAV